MGAGFRADHGVIAGGEVLMKFAEILRILSHYPGHPSGRRNRLGTLLRIFRWAGWEPITSITGNDVPLHFLRAEDAS